MNSDSGGVPCQACGKVFTLHSNLLRHFRVKHGPVPPLRRRREPQPGILHLQCPECDYKTPTSSQLERHKKVHDTKEGSLFCPMCSPSTKFTRKALHKHFVSDHNIQLSQEEMEFSSESEFLSWKAQVEKESSCKFRIRQKYTTQNVSCRVIIFRCFRDGVFKTSGVKRKRHLKMLGSVKIGGYCPASMHVRIDQVGKVSLSFCKTHVGHNLGELALMRLTQEEREAVALEIATGAPFDIILDKVRKSIGNSSGCLERRHLLTRKDLHNISREFNLQKNVGRRSKNSVQLVMAPSVDREGPTETDISSEHLVIHENLRFYHRQALLECLIDPNHPQNRETSFEEEEERLLEEFKFILKKVRKAEDFSLIEKALISLSVAIDEQQPRSLEQNLCSQKSIRNE